jgi:hypothetical protein
MKKFASIALVLLFCASVYAAEYMVLEGAVKTINGKFLIINHKIDRKGKDEQYPISHFVQVFYKGGKKATLEELASIGYINEARIYLLGGQVEKIEIMRIEH